MENREQITNVDQLIKALSICAEIQNRGIATVFCNFSGHVNITNINIHKPVWISGGSPDYQFELYHDKDDDDPTCYTERNDITISQLEEILSNGKLPEDKEHESIHNKEKIIRRQQYEELKKEFEPEIYPLENWNS